MSSRRTDNNGGEVRVELKYCEHCGGLWMRERGTGVVYCERCQAKVEDLPVVKSRRKVKLPQGPRTVVDERRPQVVDEDLLGFDALGGVAWAR